jgi:hypothetical protein
MREDTLQAIGRTSPVCLESSATTATFATSPAPTVS